VPKALFHTVGEEYGVKAKQVYRNSVCNQLVMMGQRPTSLTKKLITAAILFNELCECYYCKTVCLCGGKLKTN
jgi:hypothetical protein